MAGSGGQRSLVRSREEEEEEEEEVEIRGKKTRCEGYPTGVEMKIDRPVRDLDPEWLKKEIRRWARAVVRYARQLSRTLSSSSSSFRWRTSSLARDDADTAAASAGSRR
ncbi:hypothetical protein AXF42_Ash015302 [Apostasia shenzhenica]|uniref:Uncharacterized protein n=1 Tax=Apostasia shenzhenica TaxID=1088818 RepID=A0A2I0ALV4_9ASPA|nr:hypothetical protein AXF42_Ash015302 [Apostasia shenzhenica]